MHTQFLRPPSVWVSQLVLGFYVSVFFVVTLLGLMSLTMSNSQTKPPLNLEIISTAIFGGIAAMHFAAFIGLVKRKRWGRWLTVGVFAFMVLIQAVSHFGMIVGTGAFELVSAYTVGSLLVLVALSFLTNRLAFGRAATDFFTAQNPESDLAVVPPPPPTFEA